MNKNDRLKHDHQVWKEGGPLSDELNDHQNAQVVRQFTRGMPDYRNRVAETRRAILAKYPAKNGFIVVFREHWIKGDRPQPEDNIKVGLELEQVQVKHPGQHIAYFKYIKPIRTTVMTGTFAQNGRQPIVGQTVWLNPMVKGQVLRVCCGVPDLLSYVDLRIDGIGRVVTHKAEELFDHQPEVVEYDVDGDTIRVWE